MRIKTIARILHDQYFGRPLRDTYWEYAKLLPQLGRLLAPCNWEFSKVAIRDLGKFLFGSSRAVSGENEKRIRAAVAWILRAQAATPDDGVSLGYFPCQAPAKGWRPSYPETTGYIIPSLLTYARAFEDPVARKSALRMARWEIEIQMPSGAVQGGALCPPEKRTAAAFNTGMVLQGWSAAYRDSAQAEFLEAGRRAADFLVGDLDENGYFQTNGGYVGSGKIKTYTCLCAWPLYCIGEDTGDPHYQAIALKVIEAALRQQATNGWFSHNNLSQSKIPLVHTIGYVLQGILEVGALAEREDFIVAVRRGTDPLLDRALPDGYLSGSFYPDWEPGAFWSCLTGSAQLAVVCYRLMTLTGRANYGEIADRLTNFLKDRQILDSRNESINGAIPGSFPLFGAYMRGGYPNWATKYYLDALLLQAQSRQPVARDLHTRSVLGQPVGWKN